MPHPGQRHVRLNRERFTWLCAGRRWRKTSLMMTVAADDPAWPCVTRGATIVWTAPTYDQVWTAWEEFRRAFGPLADFNQQRMTMRFGRGAVLFRSLDNPDNARSKTAHGIIIDEVADVKEAAWQEVLRPMLLDTGGWLIGAGTPKGRNWFWREWLRAEQDRPADAVAFRAPTLGARLTAGGLVRAPHPLENPTIAFDELLSLYRTMPERSFRQEILAEFVEDGGGVFRGVRAAATVAPGSAPVEGHTYVIGADWGKSNDYTVFTVVDATARQVVALDRSNQVDYALQRGRLAALCQRWGAAVVVAETNAMGMPIVEALSRERIPVRPFVTTNASKAVIIDALALALERGEIALLDDPVLVGELEAFEVDRTPSGLTRYGAPAGAHDDCVMSLALAWSAVGRTSSAKGAFGD